MVVVVASDDAFHLSILSSRIHVTWALRSGGWLGVGNDPRYSKSRCFDPFPFPDCPDALKVKIRAAGEDLDAHRKARQAEHPKLKLTQMYNVLEKLRDGSAPGGRLPDGESPSVIEEFERIKREGLVLILKELHDKIDALVFEAYGWPTKLIDEEILERLVVLNKERAADEKAGKVRWLRPDYQIPRFGSEAEQAALKAVRDAERAKSQQPGLDLDDDDDQKAKAKFPTGDELAETTAVLHALALAPAAISIDDISQTFKGGLQNKRRVKLCVEALARLGHISSTDGGETFSLRRAA